MKKRANNNDTQEGRGCRVQVAGRWVLDMTLPRILSVLVGVGNNWGIYWTS